MMTKFLSFLMLLVLAPLAHATNETGPADYVLRVPSTGGRAKYGSDLRKIKISGFSQAVTATAKTSGYTAAATDDIITGDTTSGGFTITTPAAASYSGKTFIVKKVSSDTNELVVDGNASETIDGQADYRLVAKNSYVAIQSDGTNWIIIGKRNNWKVDSNISGGNPSLGTASVSSYTGIENGSLTLTNNSSTSALTAQIPCSSTNAPSGTTCSAGNESLGVVFTLPNPGDVLACASLTWESTNSASSTAGLALEVVETPTNAQTISQEGKSRLTATHQSASIQQNTPFRVCGILTFSTRGSKAIRVFYEQEVLNTPSSSLITADTRSQLGQRDVHWEVYPLD